MGTLKKRLPRFYTDDAEDSNIARELLKKYSVEVAECKNDVDVILDTNPYDDGYVLPCIQSGDGWFSGLNGIKSYVELVADISPLKSLD